VDRSCVAVAIARRGACARGKAIVPSTSSAARIPRRNRPGWCLGACAFAVGLARLITWCRSRVALER
jgi:hypothetical protein